MKSRDFIVPYIHIIAMILVGLVYNSIRLLKVFVAEIVEKVLSLVLLNRLQLLCLIPVCAAKY